MNRVEIAFCTIAVITIIGIMGAWKIYKYKDCKAVGHSTFYCIMRTGE